MEKSDFLFHTRGDSSFPEGEITVRAPSNIALIKYWGKYGEQLPANPSVSFTLHNSYTQTQLKYTLSPGGKPGDLPGFNLFYQGKPVPEFRRKTEVFFQRILPYVPFIGQYHFEIDTVNTFPHSSGIASSASAMSALAFAVMQLEKSISPAVSREYMMRKTSFLARLGSGSASRSVQGPVMIWGKDDAVSGSSDLYAVPFSGSTDEIFTTYRDSILLVDEGTKKVSSTAGHQSMDTHVFASARYTQARRHFRTLISALQTGDLNTFIQIVEAEALAIHALMMTAPGNYLLMREGTLSIILKIREFRKKTGIPLCFSLDAGANVHVLYPGRYRTAVSDFIISDLLPHTAKGHFIDDYVGKGVETLTGDTW